MWKYRAVALQIQTEEKIITEGEDSAQAGELAAVWSIFQHEAQSSSPEAQPSSPVYIHTDSYATFQGCTEWLSFWEQNGWEVNQVPVRQKEKWQDILQIVKQGNFAIAWVASHQHESNPTSQWNSEADESSRLAPLQNEHIMEN